MESRPIVKAHRPGGRLGLGFLFLFLMLTIVTHHHGADAHGYLSKPASRNINDYCRQCLSAGGPAQVNSNGMYRRGMCGNAYTDAAQTWNVPGNPTATYVEGQQIDVEVCFFKTLEKKLVRMGVDDI